MYTGPMDKAKGGIGLSVEGGDVWGGEEWWWEMGTTVKQFKKLKHFLKGIVRFVEEPANCSPKTIQPFFL